jgi:MraZ protein
MFTGEYRHTVDAKGRVAIPARFRLQLEEGAVVVRWVGGCAAIFPRPAFEAIASKFASQPLANENATAVSRFLFSSAFDVERDAQGRMVLPIAIREWAGLKTDAVFVGQWDRVEIWAPEKWAASQADVNTPQALASAIKNSAL